MRRLPSSGDECPGEVALVGSIDRRQGPTLALLGRARALSFVYNNRFEESLNSACLDLTHTGLFEEHRLRSVCARFVALALDQGTLSDQCPDDERLMILTVRPPNVVVPCRERSTTLTRLLTANVRWKADLATLGWKEEGSQNRYLMSAYLGST